MKRGTQSNLNNDSKKPKLTDTEFSTLYQENLSVFAKLIFSPRLKNANNQPLIFESPRAIIYNLDGYDEDIDIDYVEDQELGNRLTLKDGTPIGYNIYLPQGEVKAIMVTVYGGDEASEKEEEMYLPGYSDNIERGLREQGIAIVQLNLLDLLKLKVYQDLMPKHIHTKIHQSINHFFEVIRDNPEVLHPLLAEMKGKPIFLGGSSFGGRTAIKHAELYPLTYYGYISYGGALSYDMIAKTDLNSSITFKEWLDPNIDIKRIFDPIFLVHCKDDNCVNLKVTLDWYKNAKKNGKKELIRLWIVEKGSPIDLGSSHPYVMKGHDLPSDKNLFDDMLDAILFFVKHSPSSITPLHEWRALRANIEGNKNYKAASLQQQFVSHAYSMSQSIILNDENWEMYYVPMYYAFYYLHSSADNTNFKGKSLDNFQGQFQQDIQKLKQNNTLTPENFTRALKFSFNTFTEFLLETNQLNYKRSEMNDFAESATLHKWYQDILEGNSSNKMSYHVYKYLVTTFFKCNINLLEPKFDQWDFDDAIQTELNEARKKLEMKIETEHQLIRSVWSQAIQKIKQR